MSHLRPKGEFKNVSSDVFAKAKQMVLHGKIAPFEDGCDCEDSGGGAQQLEECPICFLSFPALNRTKCCSKGICSNCFFAVKTTDYRHEDAPPKTLRHLLLGNCPFCKCKPFEVEFKGRRSAEERQRELEEEERVQLALRRGPRRKRYLYIRVLVLKHLSSPMERDARADCWCCAQRRG